MIKLFLLPFKKEQTLSDKKDPKIAPIATILVIIPSYNDNLSDGQSLM